MKAYEPFRVTRTMSVGQRIALHSVVLLVACAPNAAHATLAGQVMVDPNDPSWFVYNRDANGDGALDSVYTCGPGDPEDFLYRGSRNGDGTRSGDQMSIINRIVSDGGNIAYFQVVRSHGGDGDARHNPFINSNPSQGLDEEIPAQWESWFRRLDDNGVIITLFLYDDEARIWNTGNTVGAQEQAFIEGIGNRFEHLKHIIWAPAEGYDKIYPKSRITRIAEVIRAADYHDHPIAGTVTSATALISRARAQ